MTSSRNPRPVFWKDLDLARFAKFVTDHDWFVRADRGDLFAYAHEPTGPISTITLKDRSGKISWHGRASYDYDTMLGNTSNRDKRLHHVKGYIPETELEDIADRNSPECWYCGLPFVEGGSPRTREHLIPISKGGDERFRNVVTAHRACNRFVGSADISIKKLMRVLLREYAKGRKAVDLIGFGAWLEGAFMIPREHDTIEEYAPVVQMVRAPISKIGGPGSNPGGGAIDMGEMATLHKLS